MQHLIEHIKENLEVISEADTKNDSILLDIKKIANTSKFKTISPLKSKYHKLKFRFEYVADWNLKFGVKLSDIEPINFAIVDSYLSDTSYFTSNSKEYSTATEIYVRGFYIEKDKHDIYFHAYVQLKSPNGTIFDEVKYDSKFKMVSGEFK